MAPNASGKLINDLPAQGQPACSLYAQALSGDLQGVFGHDPERALAYLTKGRGVGYRVVDIKQQQASDLWRFLVASYLLREEVLVRPRLTLVFELLHVIAQGVDEIVGELPVTLPGVAQQVQTGLLGLEAAQVVNGVKVRQARVLGPTRGFVKSGAKL